MKIKFQIVYVLWVAGSIFQNIGAQTSLKRTTGENGKTVSNDVMGVPTTTVDVVIRDFNFTGSYHPTLSNLSTTINKFTINSGFHASSYVFPLHRHVNDLQTFTASMINLPLRDISTTTTKVNIVLCKSNASTSPQLMTGEFILSPLKRNLHQASQDLPKYNTDVVKL